MAVLVWAANEDASWSMADDPGGQIRGDTMGKSTAVNLNALLRNWGFSFEQKEP